MTDIVGFSIIRILGKTTYAVTLPDTVEGKRILNSIGQVLACYAEQGVADRIFEIASATTAELGRPMLSLTAVKGIAAERKPRAPRRRKTIDESKLDSK